MLLLSLQENLTVPDENVCLRYLSEKFHFSKQQHINVSNENVENLLFVYINTVTLYKG